MDDDLGCIHPDNAAYMWGREMHHLAVQACQRANLVTVTTDALAGVYAPHGRVRVIPNCVPGFYLKIPHRDHGLIGWGGALRSHPRDLNVVGNSISNLCGRGVPFKIVGPPDGVARALGLTADPLCTDGVPLNYWPTELSKLGIGIAPLQLSVFNSSKSRLRPLEYSAVGVPWVASPTADYVKFHELGVGLLADTPEQWEEHLWSLHVNRALRDQMADAGREVAKANTVEAQASLWIEAWTHAGTGTT
jgi:glycosyltransferase involved in cell wall biosynthesis